MMEQAGKRGRRTGQAVPGRRGESDRLVRRLRVRPRQPDTRAARDPPGGTTAPAQELADDGGCDTCASQEARTRSRKMPQQSAERRAGLRHWPVISGDPEMGPTREAGHGCGASAPAPVGALLPSLFGERKTDEGHPPPPTGPAERWLFAPAHSLPCVFPGCPQHPPAQYKDNTERPEPWTPRTPPPP